MMQKMNLKKEATPEPEEGMEDFLEKMGAEYV